MSELRGNETAFGNPDAYKKLIGELIDRAYKGAISFKLDIHIEGDAENKNVTDAANVTYTLEKVEVIL